MKELSVLFGVYLLSILLLIACTKIASTPTIELGEQAKVTKINSVTPPISTGKVVVNLSLTTGAKYSLQLLNLKGDVIESTGLIADKDLIIKEMDYSDHINGDYTILLLDVWGKEFKRQITIKK
jgi:hypothetical protein